MSSSSEPTREQIAALAARPVDAPVVMVNLLKFKQPSGLERGDLIATSMWLVAD